MITITKTKLALTALVPSLLVATFVWLSMSRARLEDEAARLAAEKASLDAQIQTLEAEIAKVRIALPQP